MIKIALVEVQEDCLDVFGESKDVNIDYYWYPEDLTWKELIQEIEDLKEFYDLVIMPEGYYRERK